MGVDGECGLWSLATLSSQRWRQGGSRKILFEAPGERLPVLAAVCASSSCETGGERRAVPEDWPGGQATEIH